MLRRLLPRGLKLRVRLVRRALADARSGARRKFASAVPSGDFPHSLSIQQPVLNATTEQSKINKVHNIRLAAASVEAIEVRPGEIFSFWRAVGEPSQKNNFKEGINIINGEVIEDFGGGLCQLSSIIYHVAMIAGLAVLERTNHSVDLYAGKERYTPLGSDCAVFYAYKDLRLRNDHDHPVRFRFEVTDETLICYIDSPVQMKEHSISFVMVEEDEERASVVTKASDQAIAQSHYRKESDAA